MRRTVHLSNGAFTVAVCRSCVAYDRHGKVTCARRHTNAHKRCRQILVVTRCRLILVLRRLCSRCDVPACATGIAPTMICVITGSTAAVQTVDCICAALQEVWCCCNPSPTLALTLHTSLRRSAAADSHLLQTGACRACMSAACVYQSLLLCVCLRSVLTHLYVYVRQGICRHRLVPRLQVLV